MKASTKQYIRNVNSGFLKTNNEKVLYWIKHNPTTTIHELRQSGISHQTLTSRISHLQDLGLIKVIGNCNIDNKHYSQYEAVTDTYLVEELRREREQEKIMSWIKRGQELEISEDLKRVLENYKYYLNNKK
tara:strand:- start:609 stop:1001 length:393 start_codon:yes stop_codon:yes gene_type:complete